MKQTCLYRPGVGGAPDCGLRDDYMGAHECITKLKERVVELESYLDGVDPREMKRLDLALHDANRRIAELEAELRSWRTDNAVYNRRCEDADRLCWECGRPMEID